MNKEEGTGERFQQKSQQDLRLGLEVSMMTPVLGLSTCGVRCIFLKIRHWSWGWGEMVMSVWDILSTSDWPREIEIAPEHLRMWSTGGVSQLRQHSLGSGLYL